MVGRRPGGDENISSVSKLDDVAGFDQLIFSTFSVMNVVCGQVFSRSSSPARSDLIPAVPGRTGSGSDRDQSPAQTDHRSHSHSQ